MKSSYISTILYMMLLLILILGSYIEISNPEFVSEGMKVFIVKIGLAVVGFVASFFGLMFLLSFIKEHREGFQTEDVFQMVKTMLQENHMEEICSLYNELYQKIMKVEKGIPPNSFTDEQAREKTEKTMKDVIPLGPVSCAKISKLAEVKDIDTLFTLSQSLPDNFLIQSYETAKGCRELLIRNYTDIQQSLNEVKEGFVDTSVGICSPEITEERRKFLREKKLSEKAQSCLLPEEVPLDKKDSYVQLKLDKINTQWKDYRKSKESLEKILEDCSYYKKELEKLKKEAESGKLIRKTL